MKKSVKLDAEMYKGRKLGYIYMAKIVYKDGYEVYEPHATKEGAISAMDIMFRSYNVVKTVMNDKDCIYSVLGSVMNHDAVMYYTIDSQLLMR